MRPLDVWERRVLVIGLLAAAVTWGGGWLWETEIEPRLLVPIESGAR